MKDSTRKAVEYLCTPEGKAYYKQRLAYHFSEWNGIPSDWQPVYDRFYGDALVDAVERVVDLDPDEDLGYLSDDFLDNFGYERKDETYGSEIPRIVARVKKFDTMADKFAHLLDPYMP